MLYFGDLSVQSCNILNTREKMGGVLSMRVESLKITNYPIGYGGSSFMEEVLYSWETVLQK